MAIDKVFYNQASQSKLGWEPEWFGAEYNDEALVKAVRKWQRKIDIRADGLVGPMTYRRIWTERQAFISNYEPGQPADSSLEYCKANNHIVHNGKFYPIEWHKVVRWDEDGGFGINKGNYYDYSGEEERKPQMFVNHWDVCLSSETCAKILNKRGISVHFCIDNDGTIYQILDTQHGAWHASSWAGNKRGVGVEISNGYYTKYQDWYEKNGFGKRPVVSRSPIHNTTIRDYLDFYPIQLKALKALWKACHLALGIPLQCPTNADGTLCKTVHQDCLDGKFSGFVNHYNFTKGKIDCANLDMLKLLEDVKNDL